MLLVIVYVGAIAVLFLFVVMMLDIDFAAIKKGTFKLLPIVLVLGGALFYLMYYSTNKSELQPKAHQTGSFTKGNVQLIGEKLYTEYVVEFQTSGIILLIAMIGAITPDT